MLDEGKRQSNRPQSCIDLSEGRVLDTLKNKVSSCQIRSGADALNFSLCREILVNVSASISNSRVAAKRKARSMRSGSDEKIGPCSTRIFLLLKSSCPL